MKLVTLVTLFALLAVGCAAAPGDSDGAAAGGSALVATDEDRVCFAVVDHPFNGNGEVWQLDGTSLLHTQTFYWHGTPMRDFLGKNPPAPTVYPLLENTETRIVAGDASDPIAIDITRGDFGGSAVLHQSGHDDVVLPRVGTCR